MKSKHTTSISTHGSTQLRAQYESSFQTAYDKLNPEQRRAVDTIEGPVLVVAGPGTGKTQVLTMRIANILRLTDTKPSSILALTFTESAAQNMRLRLASLIGPDAYYVQISTFHSFCAQVISNHLEYFPLNPASQPITELERFELVRSIVEELPLESVKPLNSPLFHVRSLLTNISTFKREGVTTDAFQELVRSQWVDPTTITSKTLSLKTAKRQQQLTEQGTVYEAYEQRLRSAGRYDFDDMLALTVEVLSREEVLLQEYQEQYLYLLVDEYQDTNTVQNNVTRLLASFWGEQANIFAVGDPHQSIYRFQGASLENITQFMQWYPRTALITLSEGYRCPQELYELAHTLIKQDTSLTSLELLGDSGSALHSALSQVLKTDKTSESAVTVVKSPDQMTGQVALMEKISALLADGVAPNEIAILYTKNRYGKELMPLLSSWGIPFHVEGGLDALAQPIVQQFVTMCLVIVALRQGGDGSAQVFEICNYPWFAIDRTTLFQLSRYAGTQRQTLLEVLRLPSEVLKVQMGDELDVQELEKIHTLLTQLEEWGALDFTEVFTNWLATVVHASGLHEYVVKQSQHHIEPLLSIYSLFAFVKQLNASNAQFRVADFIRAVDTLQQQHVTIPVQTLTSTDNRIRLSSVHKAKGQEWMYVFVLHVVDGVWGNRRPPSSLPVPEGIVATAPTLAEQSKELANQDDRRLLYVALTRAKEKVELLHSEQSEQDGVVRPRVPSMFLSELAHQPQIKEVDAQMQSTPAQVASILIGPEASKLSVDSKLEAYLRQIVGEFPLSITALNNYLRDPSRFLYQNLLAMPSAKAPHLAYGTAMHAALELLGSRRARSGDPVGEDELLARFDQQLQRELLTDVDRVRRQQRGHEVLRAYSALTDLSTAPVWRTEYKIGYASSAAFLDDIRLTGRMDRLDWIDETHKAVRVIDYKTGSPKTKNEILVATETARRELSERERSLPEGIRGAYQRQLLFYRLLAQLDRSFEPDITLGTFDFVEAALDSEKLVQHTFTLSDDAVEELKTLIRAVMSEIRSLKFLADIPEFTA